jgi:type II secretory pathway pseudopilin PulG
VTTTSAPHPQPRHDEAGFTLLELLVSVAILMVISGLMMRSTMDMQRLSTHQAGRSEMHAGVRNATALLQQEVGQAGRVSLPAAVTLIGAVTATGNQWQYLSPSTTAVINAVFVGERLNIGLGSSQEVVTVAEVDTSGKRIRATFGATHPAGAPVRPVGGFAQGIIPTNMTDGSTASVLKIVGDINSDGNLRYVEYTCDWNVGRLYRNMMAYNATSKPALTVEHVLLDNLLPNPNDPNGNAAPCFRYQQQTIESNTYVTNVAIMTTVRTQSRDPFTGEFQTVTKALLNVAPRNVFYVWQMASLDPDNAGRIQPLPPSVLNLLD